MELNSIEDVATAFPDELSVRNHWVNIRWGKWAHCPYCGNEKAYFIENGVRYKCANKLCYKRFTVTVKTIFEASNIDLTIWQKVIFFYVKRRGKVSAGDLTREFKFSPNTSFWVLQRLDFVWPFVERESKSTLEIMNDIVRQSHIQHDKYVKVKEAPYFKNPFHVSDIDNIGDERQYFILLRYTDFYLNVYAKWIWYKFATPSDILSEVFIYMADNKIKEYNTEHILHLIWKVTDKMWRKNLKEHPKFNEYKQRKSKQYSKNSVIMLDTNYIIKLLQKTNKYSHLTRNEIRSDKALIESTRLRLRERRKNLGLAVDFISHFD